MNNDQQLKELNEKIEKENNDNRKRRVLYFIFFIVLLFFSTFGITYSIYKGDSGNNNEIVTDKIVFSYSDVDKSGSGINIKNAVPTADDKGKYMMGDSQYFDFSITATSKSAEIDYKILVKKNDISTISNNKIRIYLTKVTGGYEEGLVLDNFSNLKQERINDIDYYVLYTKTLNKGIEDYSDFYRLRMWLDEKATNYDNQMFSINVDVQAVQGGN